MKTAATNLGVCAWIFGCALLAQSAYAQERTLSEREVSEQLEQSLPAWDKSVLDVKDGPDWSAKHSFDSVLKALGEKALSSAAADDGRRATDGSRVLRLTREHGKVRFVERARTWNPAQTATKPVAADAAAKLALNVLDRLGVPRAELGKSRVDVQQGLEEGLRSSRDSRLHNMYSLVSVDRRVGRLEVYGSRARLAVTNAGQLQRVRLTWPAFRLAKGLTMRERKVVLEEAVKTVVQQQPIAHPDEKFIQARLAYVPETATLPYLPQPASDETPSSTKEDVRDADDDVSKLGPEKFSYKRLAPVEYVPAVVIAVAAAPTPYELLIPIAD